MARKVVITGGSSGLGLALARAFVVRGDTVALVARDEHKLAQAAAELRAFKPACRVHTVAADVQDAQTLALHFDALAASMGGLDVLVSSAGILREGYFETLSIDVHRDVMAVNYFGTLHAIHAAMPHLRRSTSPRIVVVASMAGLTGVFGYSAYCASKHALVGLSEALRCELAPQGIAVQLVCPGEFDSPMVDALDPTRTPENREHTLTIPKVGVDVIVRDTMRALGGDEFLIVPGTWTKLSAFGLRHFPRISRALGDARIRTVDTRPRPSAHRKPSR